MRLTRGSHGHAGSSEMGEHGAPSAASTELACDTTIGRPPAAPPAFHLLAKPTGAVWNLDCSDRFFLSKEMLYPGSRFRMADELLETVHSGS